MDNTNKYLQLDWVGYKRFGWHKSYNRLDEHEVMILACYFTTARADVAVLSQVLCRACGLAVHLGAIHPVNLGYTIHCKTLSIIALLTSTQQSIINPRTPIFDSWNIFSFQVNFLYFSYSSTDIIISPYLANRQTTAAGGEFMPLCRACSAVLHLSVFGVTIISPTPFRHSPRSATP